jgi:hypothetical protein
VSRTLIQDFTVAVSISWQLTFTARVCKFPQDETYPKPTVNKVLGIIYVNHRKMNCGTIKRTTNEEQRNLKSVVINAIILRGIKCSKLMACMEDTINPHEILVEKSHVKGETLGNLMEISDELSSFMTIVIS